MWFDKDPHENWQRQAIPLEEAQEEDLVRAVVVLEEEVVVLVEAQVEPSNPSCPNKIVFEEYETNSTRNNNIIIITCPIRKRFKKKRPDLLY